MSIPELKLKQGKDRALRFRHPWIFSGAIQRIPNSLTPGTIVDLLSADGAFYARGTFEGGSIAVKILSFARETIDQAFFEARLTEALDIRRRVGVFQSGQTNAYRLVHGEGDYLPGLIVDIYDRVVVAHCQSLGMSQMADHICAALRRVLGAAVESLVLKKNETDGLAGHGKPELIFGSRTESEIIENGAKYFVDCLHGQKTGFFLDQRDNRLKLRSFVVGKRVLNAFCYSGGFTINAFLGGAARVDSIDSSWAALDLLRRNLSLNNFSSDNAEVSGEVIEADCFKVLPDIAKDYEVIVLDPPAFAKHRKDIQAALRGYQFINAAAIRGLPIGGILVTFSCSQLVSKDDFWAAIQAAAAETGRHVRIIGELHQAACHPISAYHPEGLYLKGLILIITA